MSTKKLGILRDQVAALVAQRDEIADSAITRGEAEAKFDHLIARVKNDAIMGLGPGSLRDGGAEREFAEWVGRAGFLCELFGTEIKAAMLARFDAEAGGSTGLAVGERREKLVELDGQIYQLEQQEELLIELLEADGHDIARRPAADPHAALGLPGQAAA